MLKNAILFSLSANPELAKAISKILGVPLADRTIKKFPSGETIVEPCETVRGKDVFIIQSTCPPVNENIMESLIFVDALRRASARVINFICPYFGYARQDRKAKPRQPITSALVAHLLTTAGVDRVVTVNLHASQIQGFFNCLVDDLTAVPLLGDAILKANRNITDDIVVVSPDHGGVNRARDLAEMFKCPLAIIDKRRKSNLEPEVMNIIGDVKGKVCFMIDDMIDTSRSACIGANALRAAGATKVDICAVHPVFSDPAYELISQGPFDQIFVTDSIPLNDKFSKLSNIKVVTIAPLLAETILRIETDKSLSEVYDSIGAADPIKG